jgi:DNA mismatch repair protein MutS
MRDAESIELRLSAVDELVTAPTLQETLATALKDVGDLERLVSRAAQGHAGARELVALRRSLEAIPSIREAAGACESLAIRELTAQIAVAPELSSELARGLVDEPPSHARDGGAV